MSKAVILHESDFPSKDVLLETIKQLNRTISVIKKYPTSGDNILHLQKGIEFLENLLVRIK